MIEIYIYTSNRRDKTVASIDYNDFIEIVNQYFTKDYISDDNDYLQFKRNVKRKSTILTADNARTAKNSLNAFKLTRNRDAIISRAHNARLASNDLEYMDEQGFYIPNTEGIISFNHSISPSCNDDVIINSRFSITVDIETVGDFVKEYEALMKRYNIEADISENTNIEITDTALENAFAV